MSNISKTIDITKYLQETIDFHILTKDFSYFILFVGQSITKIIDKTYRQETNKIFTLVLKH